MTRSGTVKFAVVTLVYVIGLLCIFSVQAKKPGAPPGNSVQTRNYYGSAVLADSNDRFSDPNPTPPA